MNVLVFGCSLLHVFGVVGLNAQSTSPAFDTPTCTSCRILAVFRDRINDAALIRDSSTWWPVAMTRDARGNYLLVRPEPEEAAPMVFDPDGHPVGRVGKVGNGPGQFRRPFLVWRDGGDSVHIADNALRRHTVLDPKLHFVRSSPLPVGVNSAGSTSAGQLIVDVREPGDSGAYLQVLNSNGTLLSSFSEAMIAGNQIPGPRVLGVEGNGSVWAVRQTGRYEIERWDSTGHLLMDIRPVRDWFPTYDRYVPPGASGKPSPAVMGIWVDSTRSLLWIFGVAPDSSGSGRGGPARTLDYRSQLDGIVDVFDLRNRTLLASNRFDTPFLLVLGDGLVAGFEIGDWDQRRIDVYEMRLESSPRSLGPN